MLRLLAYTIFSVNLLLAFSVGKAQNASADLILYAKQGNAKFIVGVNGVQYNAKPVSGIRITEVPTPLCVVQLVIAGATTDTITRNIYLKNDGDYFYLLDTTKQNGKFALYYEAEDISPKQLKGFLRKIFLPPALKHVVIDTTAMYHVRGAATIIESQKKLRAKWLQKGRCNTPETTPLVFNAVKGKIREKSFESDKLQIAKQQISAHCFSARQIEELLQLFDFERVKLDVAKFAYHYLTDTENYAVFYDAFEFDTTIKEWNRYVALMQTEIEP